MQLPVSVPAGTPPSDLPRRRATRGDRSGYFAFLLPRSSLRVRALVRFLLAANSAVTATVIFPAATLHRPAACMRFASFYSVSGGPQRELPSSRKCHQARWNTVLVGSLTRRFEFCDDFTAIRHQDAFAEPDFPNVLAQMVFKLPKTYASHV